MSVRRAAEGGRLDVADARGLSLPRDRDNPGDGEIFGWNLLCSNGTMYACLQRLPHPAPA